MAPKYLEPVTDFDVCGNFGIDNFTLAGAEARYPAIDGTGPRVLPQYLRSMTLRADVDFTIAFVTGGETFTVLAGATVTFGTDLRGASLSGKHIFVNGAAGTLEILFEFTQTP